ncbi:hypothetical protein B9Z55_026492 [Caenorhabditis nigoni]|uniref:Uncharacterized protein n=1 Tax=Caenorhabditis nigoni TaxID=1611254 RepID=A0A2G5T3X1_9PELO|nr:hypothetical protein B9Z55_026492 [Caenorhabditis nigoni]
MDHSAFTRCLNSRDQTNQLVPFFPRNEVMNNGLDFQMANSPQRTLSNVSINPIIAPGAGQPFPGIMPHNMLNMNNFLPRNPWNLLNQYGTSQQFPEALSLISSSSTNNVQDPPDGLNPGKCET